MRHTWGTRPARTVIIPFVAKLDLSSKRWRQIQLSRSHPEPTMHRIMNGAIEDRTLREIFFMEEIG